MQIHLDALGGLAGDMFVAALLDAFPEHEAGVRAAVSAASRPGVGCERLAHDDGILAGSRFRVVLDGDDSGQPTPHADDGNPGDHWHLGDHAHPGDGAKAPHRHWRDEAHGSGDHRHDHSHRPWSDIRESLGRAGLDPAVRDHAIAIFSGLAEAEARVHGIAVEAVAFHEVGAWDSIADVVAAAHLIATLGASRWSVSALPLGSGRVGTRHGPLPVPAPATALLLRGFSTLDDGIPGERVTPTGAAILRHLCPGGGGAKRAPAVLGRTGIGFGTRTLPGISNCLRALVFEEGTSSSEDHREIAVIEFEVDDQSGEDLAMGLDRLRAEAGVFDVVQMPVFGKKGRMMTHVRVLASAARVEAAAAACFRETTTIGLRHRVVSGAALPREASSVSVDGRPVRVKLVERPGGRTAKAEADDALTETGHAGRAALRRRAEALALDPGKDEA